MAMYLIANPLNYKTNHPFYSLQVIKERTNRGNKKRNKNKIRYNTDQFIQYVSNNENIEVIEVYNKIKMLSKQNLKSLVNLSLSNDFLCNANQKTKLIVLCLLTHIKYNTSNINKQQENKSFKYIDMEYKGDIFDRINFNKIFNNNRVKDIIRNSSTKEFIPFRVVYTYKRPISSTIFNYNQFLKNTNLESCRNILSRDCICRREKSKYKSFIDTTHEHIITGNLNIIENYQLKEILKKGTKYRPVMGCNRDTIHSTYSSAVEKVVSHISRYCRISQDQVNQLRNLFNAEYRNKIKPLLSHENIRNKVHIPYQTIQRLQSDFIFCPLDKANNNYSIICEKFYLLNLMKEMGINYENKNETFNNSNTNITYVNLNVSNKQPIIEKHRYFQIKNKLKVDTN